MIISCLIGSYLRLTIEDQPVNIFPNITLSTFQQNYGNKLNEFSIVKLEDRGLPVFQLKSNQCDRNIYFYADKFTEQLPDMLRNDFFSPVSWKHYFVYNGEFISGLSGTEKKIMRISNKISRLFFVRQFPSKYFIFSIMVPLECKINEERLIEATQAYLDAFKN